MPDFDKEKKLLPQPPKTKECDIKNSDGDCFRKIKKFNGNCVNGGKIYQKIITGILFIILSSLNSTIRIGSVSFRRSTCGANV